MTQTKQAAALSSIEQMISRVMSKVGNANTEPGGYVGETTHQSKNEDDRTEDAREGFRSDENEEDVRDDQGPASVENEHGTPKAAESSGTPEQDRVQMNIGLQSASTGQDPENETDRVKSTKEDGGTYQGSTSHPARTDNSELNGGKYAAIAHRIDQNTKLAAQLGRKVLAALATDLHDQAKQANQQPAPTTPAAAAGREAAQAAIAMGQDKIARDRQVLHDVFTTIGTAYQLADRVANVVYGFKAAAEAELGEEEESEPAEGGDGGGDTSESEGGGDVAGGDLAGLPMGSEPGGDAEADAILSGLSGGGGDIGAGDALAAMGGPPPGGEMAVGGGDPMAMGGGGSMGGDPTGGDPLSGLDLNPEQLQQLLMLATALKQSNVSADRLAKATGHGLAKKLASLERLGLTVQDWSPKTATQKAALQGMLNFIAEHTK